MAAWTTAGHVAALQYARQDPLVPCAHNTQSLREELGTQDQLGREQDQPAPHPYALNFLARGQGG